VESIRHVKDAGMRINGGFFVFRSEIFDWIGDGEDLVEEPFQRLAAAGRLFAYEYDGFWACMDTFKEKQALEDMYTRGRVPWEVWRGTAAPRPAVGDAARADWLPKAKVGT
jgi:glucose-1-phosphate cytidylyltransferase